MAFMNNERKFEFRFRFHGKEPSKKKEYIKLKTPIERKKSSIDTNDYPYSSLIDVYLRAIEHNRLCGTEVCPITKVKAKNEREMIDSYFLGYHLNHEREIAKYIVALRHGLERDGKFKRRIHYKKATNFMELLARDLKPINVELWKHDEHCRCDVKTNTCKRRKKIDNALERMRQLRNMDSQKKTLQNSAVQERLEKMKAKKEKHDQWMLARKKKQVTDKESRKVLLSTTIDTKAILEKKRKREQDERTILKLMEELIRTAENLNTITEEDKDEEEEENCDKTNLPTFPIIERESIENSLTIEPFRTKEREEELIPTTTPTEGKLPPIKTPIENLLLHENENEINPGEKDDFLLKLPQIQTKTAKKKKKHCRKTKVKEEEFTKEIDSVQNETPIASTQNADNGNKVQRLIKKKQRLEYTSKNENLSFPKIEVIKEVNEEKEDEGNIEEKVEEKLEEKNEEKYEPPKYLEVDLGKPHIVQQLVLEHLPEANAHRKSKKKRKLKRRISKSFTMEYSMNGDEWFTYNDVIGDPLVFRDKTKASTSIHVLNEGLHARFIRVFPTSGPDGISIPKTLLGVEAEAKPKKRRDIQKKERRSIFLKEEPQTMLHLPEPIKEEASTPTLSPQSSPAMANREDSKSPVPETLKSFEEESKMCEQDLEVNTMKLEPPTINATVVSEKKLMFEDLNDENEETSKTDEEKLKRERAKALADRRRSLKLQLEIRKKKEQHFRACGLKNGLQEFRSHSANEELEFFEKYSIISKDQRDWYSAIYQDFLQQEESQNDNLPLEDAMDGLRIVNKSFTTDEELTYILLVLETLGVHTDDQMTFDIFCIIAAFAEKINNMWDFYRLTDYEIDYDTLLFCVSKAKLLYQVMLRSNENFIHTEDLLIEFKAGNTQESYLKYILQNDGKSKLDFMDYLTYFPLFINTHKNIIEMPYS